MARNQGNKKKGKEGEGTGWDGRGNVLKTHFIHMKMSYNPV